MLQSLASPVTATIHYARSRRERDAMLAAHGLCRICEIEAIYADGMCLPCWGNDRAAP